jgi:para-aminobenzoate synthetase/4-amino-4-deoxychorismate lyase
MILPPAADSAVQPCFALFDDADATAAQPRSRLYTGYRGRLQCTSADQLPALLATMQAQPHAVGLFAYELGAAMLHTAERAIDSPLAEILLFDACTLLSAAEVSAWLAQQVIDAGADGADVADLAGAAGVAGVAALKAGIDASEFDAAIARIHAYITAGDVYQINLTMRLHFEAYGSPAALYSRLRLRQPVPYGALVVLPDGRSVLSLSPELFMRHSGGQLLARPMKGTAAASSDPQVDRAHATALAADPKNRAENLMIVDLLRNDMSRVAALGSVQVPALFDVERYQSVLQMTSTITATLREDVGLGDVFDAMFPCGSITGAPKRRAMQIIRELEPEGRGLYTGALGWFTAPAPERSIGDYCLSVPIRTLTLAPPDALGLRRGILGVGAGIVHDSVAADEFAECLLKAEFLTGLPAQFSLFETMHAERIGGVRHWPRHLARLTASAAYFGLACNVASLTDAVQQACADLPADRAWRLRLTLAHDGTHTLQSGALTALQAPVRLLVSPVPVDGNDLFLRHKTTLRSTYDAAWRAAEAVGAFDMLFWNAEGALTEGARSNVFLKIDGRWLTPPLSAGVLPGVMRAVLLADPAWQASESPLRLEDLYRAEQVVVCNALRGVLGAVVVPPSGS